VIAGFATKRSVKLFRPTYICMCAKRTHKICSVPLLYNRGQSNGEENKKICTNKSLSLITCICQFSIIYFILLYLYIIRTYLIVKTSVHKKYLCTYARTYFLNRQCTNANGRRRACVCRFACSYLSLICLNVCM